MAGEVQFYVNGFAEIHKRLAHLPDACQRKGLEPLLVKSLLPTRDLARSLAPDDPTTGPPRDLRSSIIASKNAVGYRPSRSAGSASAFVGPTRFGYPQALFKEFGTVKMVATPYLRPAYAATREIVVKIIAAGFGEQVEKTLRKYGAT